MVLGIQTARRERQDDFWQALAWANPVNIAEFDLSNTHLPGGPFAAGR